MGEAQENAQANREELTRVLGSSCFARAERISKLLRFVVERHLEGRDSELKESLIGVEVYGRNPGYDPKADSTVRTEAVRLRARLDKYYSTDGRHDPVVIMLPKGGYVPEFHFAAPQGAEARQKAATWPWIGAALAAVTIAILVWFRFGAQNSPIQIAVLPLINLSQDAANEYFADGLTAEIIRNLSIIDGLAVRSQTSSFAFKGKPRNVREVGSQLEADYIVEGSVLRSGQQLRINAQLIRIRDDLPLWSASYDRGLSNVVAVQDEISRGIVNSLRLKLGRGQRRYDTNTEAYELYLRARALGAQVFMGDDEVIRLFELSVARDPSLAPAQAGLAVAYAWGSIGGRNQKEKLANLRPTAEKAIQLDPLLPEAHSALGVAYARNGQWDLAERSFRRAIEIDPNSSVAHGQFSRFFFWPLGRMDEAVLEARKAVRNDPLSSRAHIQLGDVLLSVGRYDEAALECGKPVASIEFTNDCLARARIGQGRTDEAIAMLARTDNWGYLAYAYGKAGRRDEVERLATEGPLAHPSNRGHFQYALLYAGLGNKDRTLKELDQWTGVGPARMGFTLNSPEFAFLRGDPRVKALRAMVGLPAQ
ncbi:MAG: tetratricopeptide repeat protein [Bryobacterales bacterium]|nr:tetratricopeptide repeat protein [Bryobacterales bacterium]MBV9398945.1 tetratricopeptide repeat protein [Bryobacterales bacterium]